MRILRFRDSSNSGSVTTIASVSSIVSGIGFGEPANQTRAQAEAIERFWQKRGPSDRARVYSISSEASDDTICCSSTPSSMFVDSSGTAVDRNLSRAIEAACAEFIERQSIIAHWRLSTPGRPIDRPCYFSNGECSLRDVSIFPGIYVVLALFRRNKGSCSVVKYSAGASSSTNLNEATDKAVRECHQAYLSMQDNVFRRATGRLLMDRIQEEYLNANKATTVDCWPRLTSTESKLHTAHVNTGTALSVLQSVLEPPLLILDSIFYDGEPWYVARLMSDIWPAGLHDNRPSAIKALVRLTGIEECRHDAVPFG